jgi:cell wall assembly regulator SMI1
MSRKSRIIGTSDSAISNAESELGFEFPVTFREWLKHNNGRSIESVKIFPVFDERDPRTTWDSIVRNFKSNWNTWLENFGPKFDLKHLLPFGEFGTGDYFCFDFSTLGTTGEPIVTLWSHESGKTEFVANTFADFIDLVEAGEINY